MCKQEKIIYDCPRCGFDFIFRTTTDVCDIRHNIVRIAPEDNKKTNTSGEICVWCSEREYMDPRQRRYYEDLFSTAELYTQAMSRAQLSSGAREACEEALRRLSAQMRQAAEGSRLRVIQMLMGVANATAPRGRWW